MDPLALKDIENQATLRALTMFAILSAFGGVALHPVSLLGVGPCNGNSNLGAHLGENMVRISTITWDIT